MISRFYVLSSGQCMIFVSDLLSIGNFKILTRNPQRRSAWIERGLSKIQAASFETDKEHHPGFGVALQVLCLLTPFACGLCSSHEGHIINHSKANFEEAVFSRSWVYTA